MQYTWYVPQDVQGYINEAGKELFRKRLDELFTVELPDDIPEHMIYRDVSEPIGMEMSLVIMSLTSTTT